MEIIRMNIEVRRQPKSRKNRICLYRFSLLRVVLVNLDNLSLPDALLQLHHSAI